MAHASKMHTVQTVGFGPGVDRVPVSSVVQALVNSVAGALRRNSNYAVQLQRVGSDKPPHELGLFHSDNTPDTAYPVDIPASYVSVGDTLRLVVCAGDPTRTPLYYTGDLVLSLAYGTEGAARNWLVAPAPAPAPADIPRDMSLGIVATPAAAQHDEYEDEHVQRKMAFDQREPMETREPPSIVSSGVVRHGEPAIRTAFGKLPLTARKPQPTPRAAH